LAKLDLSPSAESSLRVFLGFKALWHRADGDEPVRVDGAALKAVVDDLFVLIPGPKEIRGTIRLRGKDGSPDWLTNDSYRGSFQDYAGPNKAGRHLFQDEDYRKPLDANAANLVVAALGAKNKWPPRDVLATIVLRNEVLDPSLDWDELTALARERFGLTSDEWDRLTSPPALGEVAPFNGPEWDPDDLAVALRPEHAKPPAGPTAPPAGLPPKVSDAVQRVLAALERHGDRALVALAGVPGTSKSHVARLAARKYASGGCLREIQFSPGYTYEEFIEGPRLAAGSVSVEPGMFMELNWEARENPDKQYVLLIEEFTRADLPKVLGEVLTFVEYREEDDFFTTMYDRRSPKRIAKNLAVLVTYNPTDKSAVNLDAAIIRRLRILQFPPDVEILREMLAPTDLSDAAVDQLVAMFEACRTRAGDERFADVMPFGHAVFHSVVDESDLYELWQEELRPLLVRPRAAQHELFPTIVEHYPWTKGPTVVVPQAGDEALPAEEAPSTVEPAPAAETQGSPGGVVGPDPST